MNNTEKMYFVSDWYLNGDWNKVRENFYAGGKGDHRMSSY